MNEVVSLPDSWTMAPLASIAEINPRSFCPLPAAAQLPVHFVPMSAVIEEFGGIDVSMTRLLAEVQKGYTAFLPNDVLFAKITPCMENGKLAVVPTMPHQIAFGSTEFHVLRALPAVHPAWLAYYLSQTSFRKLARQNMTGSAGQMRVAISWLSSITIPVAPIAEQSRILEKIEECFSGLDDGIAELNVAKKKLAQYRHSLLKAAVEGSLTASWREAQRQQSGEPKETGAQLLERILTERRARWEATQFAKFDEQGKAPPKGWQAKYPEPITTDTTNLPNLPEDWVWASLDELVSMVRNGLSQKPFTEPVGYPILRINAVRPMSVNINEVRYLAIDEREAAAYIIEDGDLLATRYNGSVDLLGVVGLVRNLKVATLHPDKLIRIKPVLLNTLAEWIEVCAGVGVSRQHVVSRVKTTAGQKGISGEDIKKMPIPLAPLDEQLFAIDKLANALLVIDRQANAIAVSLKQSFAQRQNILKAAFSGQLVPQDPNDEPADVLLERIRAERAAVGIGARPGRKSRGLS